MSQRLRTVLAVVLGFVVGSVVNMALLQIGMNVIPPPPGSDLTTPEGLSAAMPHFELKHFLYPFLAHALGTFAGALLAVRMTSSRTAGPAYVVGIVFLLAGIANNFMLPAPFWFEALDVVVAYLPMAWLAGRLAARPSAETKSAS